MSTHAEILPPLPSMELGRYQHVKGGVYDVIGVARHSESLEAMVLYRPVAGDGTVWVRPHAMFTSLVPFEGQLRPRFAKLAPTEPT